MQLMISTPVLKLASDFPRLGHLLSLIGTVAVFRAHLILARTLVKCVLYIALGPREDKHLLPQERAERRAVALKWASDLIALIRRDRIQSEFYFIENAAHSPKPQVSLMTDLGFSRSSLSAAVVQQLVTQLLAKVEAVDTFFLNHPQLTRAWTHEGVKDQLLIGAAKYCSLRHSLSIKCVPLLENGSFALPLAEKIINSPVRRLIPNYWSSAAQVPQTTTKSQEYGGTEGTECICGMANEFIERLFANSATQFQKLGAATRAQLLQQCPKALTIEIERTIKQVIARPFAAKSAIQDVAANLIEASLLSPPVFVHWSSITRRLISGSTHPSIICLYSNVSESVFQRLQSAKKRPSAPIASYWPCPLFQLLSTIPKSSKQYLGINMALERLTGQQNPGIIAGSASITSIWFTILGFPSWIRRAYELIVENVECRRPEENEAIFRFLSWHAHPVSLASRDAALEDMVKQCDRISRMYSESKLTLMESEEAILISVLDSHPLVHPLLLYFWKSDSKSIVQTGFGGDGASCERILTLAVQRKSPTLCVPMVLEYLESQAEELSKLIPVGGGSGNSLVEEKRQRLRSIFEALHVVLKPHPSILDSPDVKSRMNSIASLVQ